MNITLLHNMFSGEISPLIEGRVDSPVKELGARRMENFIPMTTGGIMKRQGTWFGTESAGNSPDKKTRLIEWKLSSGRVLLVEAAELSGGYKVIMLREPADGKLTFYKSFSSTHLDPQLKCPDFVIDDDFGWAVSGNYLCVVNSNSEPFFLVYKDEWRTGESLNVWLPEWEGSPFLDAAGNMHSPPRAVAFYAGRLCFGGFRHSPNKIVMSRPIDSRTGENRYTDFTAFEENEGIVTGANGIIIEKNDMGGGRLQWLASGKRLLAGTSQATWSDNGRVPNAADIEYDMNIVEYSGTGGVQAKGLKELIVYTGRTGKSLRALLWNQNEYGAGYVDIGISDQAAHLFTSGIKDFAVSNFPFPMIWIVTGDGELVSCTVDIKGGFTAFARHPMERKINAIAVIKEAENDYIFIETLRKTGSPYFLIEYFSIGDLINDDFNENHFVDCGERKELDPPSDTVDGLHRFNGETVSVFADGAVHPPVRVENSTAKLQREASVVHIGYPVKSVFETGERQMPANGTSLGKKRRLEKVTLRLFRSLGGKAGSTSEKADELITKRYGKYEMGSPPEPFTGDIDLTVSGSIDTEGKYIIEHDSPVPFTLLALASRVAVLEA